MAAEQLHAKGSVFERLVDQSFHFFFARRVGLECEGRRSKLQDRHINTDAVFGNAVEHVFERTGHIKGCRHAVHRQHLGTEMHV